MKQSNRNKIILKPTKIYCSNNFHNPAIIGEELINIFCGLNFSALLFKNGQLLTFGDNQYWSWKRFNREDWICRSSWPWPKKNTFNEKEYYKKILKFSNAMKLFL